MLHVTSGWPSHHFTELFWGVHHFVTMVICCSLNWSLYIYRVLLPWFAYSKTCLCCTCAAHYQRTANTGLSTSSSPSISTSSMAITSEPFLLLLLPLFNDKVSCSTNRSQASSQLRIQTSSQIRISRSLNWIFVIIRSSRTIGCMSKPTSNQQSNQKETVEA